MEVISRKEAKERGLKFYYTGKPCKHGHDCQRYVCNMDCVECSKIKTKRWIDNNKSRKRETAKQWKRRNKDKNSEQFKRWYESNKDHCSNKSKEYHATNKEFRRRQMLNKYYDNHEDRRLKRRMYYLENKEYLLEQSRQEYHLNKEYWRRIHKEWCAKNKGVLRDIKARRRSAKKNATPIWHPTEKDDIKELYIMAQRLSEETGLILEVDHIIPLQSDVVCGLHCYDNLRIIPASVNRSKGNKIHDL